MHTNTLDLTNALRFAYQRHQISLVFRLFINKFCSVCTDESWLTQRQMIVMASGQSSVCSTLCLTDNIDTSKVRITVPWWGESPSDQWIPRGTVMRKMFPFDDVIIYWKDYQNEIMFTKPAILCLLTVQWGARTSAGRIIVRLWFRL